MTFNGKYFEKCQIYHYDIPNCTVKFWTTFELWVKFKIEELMLYEENDDISLKKTLTLKPYIFWSVYWHNMRFSLIVD